MTERQHWCGMEEVDLEEYIDRIQEAVRPPVMGGSEEKKDKKSNPSSQGGSSKGRQREAGQQEVHHTARHYTSVTTNAGQCTTVSAEGSQRRKHRLQTTAEAEYKGRLTGRPRANSSELPTQLCRDKQAEDRTSQGSKRRYVASSSSNEGRELPMGPQGGGISASHSSSK
jgi:hypothetical protein